MNELPSRSLEKEIDFEVRTIKDRVILITDHYAEFLAFKKVMLNHADRTAMKIEEIMNYIEEFEDEDDSEYHEINFTWIKEKLKKLLMWTD